LRPGGCRPVGRGVRRRRADRGALGKGGGEAEVAAGEVGGFIGDEVEFELLGFAGGVEELDEDVAAGLTVGEGFSGMRYIVAKNG